MFSSLRSVSDRQLLANTDSIVVPDRKLTLASCALAGSSVAALPDAGLFLDVRLLQVASTPVGRRGSTASDGAVPGAVSSVV
jgi:hypothetical protein